jgi:ribosomal protein S18 acetylase RimI-like enzyme
MSCDEGWLGRLVIEPLDRKRHDRAAFSCGETRIDNFLKNPAAKHADNDFSKTYVAVEPPSDEIVGYYTLCPHAIDVSTLPERDQKKLPRYPTIGAFYLSMIGVDSKFQGKGLGTFLLADAIKMCVGAADKTGGAFIVLDVLNDKAGKLYRRYGFHDLPAPGQESRMLISMGKARAALTAV